MTVLFKYQKSGVRQIERFDGRALLADEMGLGKTIQSLWWAKNFLDPNDGPIVVVCPATIKWNWQREAATHCNLRAEVLGGRTPPMHFGSSAPIYVINYDILGKGRKSWLAKLKKCKPQLIIVDECQYIKSRSAQRTKAVRTLCKGVPHVIMMSGTPLTNRPSELWPALNILRPDQFPSFTEFGFRYCQPELKPWGWEFKGANNLEELHSKLTDLCMIRRRKADVLKDLPPKIRTAIALDIEDRAQYQRAERDFIAWLHEVSPARARSALMAQYLVKRGYLKRLAAELKLKNCLSWIKDFLDNGEKLIVFGVHKRILRPIQEQFKDISVLVDGEVTGRKRQLAIDKFTKSKKCRLLVGNVQAAGVGWNGTAAAAVVFVELPWPPGEVVQAEDRIHRIGQTKQSLCYYLVARQTVEEDLCVVLREKQEIISQVLDADAHIEDLDIIARIEQGILLRNQ